MKRTSLKRKTPLKAKVGLKRTPMKIKPKRYPISKDELEKVDERARGLCEWCGDNCIGNVALLEYAHIEHRGMGGVQGDRAKIINDHRNISKVCRRIHDIIDGRVILADGGGIKTAIVCFLKDKISWHEWHEENKGVINR